MLLAQSHASATLRGYLPIPGLGSHTMADSLGLGIGVERQGESAQHIAQSIVVCMQLLSCR